jgi:hypothetical protein
MMRVLTHHVFAFEGIVPNMLKFKTFSGAKEPALFQRFQDTLCFIGHNIQFETP